MVVLRLLAHAGALAAIAALPPRSPPVRSDGLFSWCDGERLPAPCAAGTEEPWCDPDRATEARVAALLSNLSVAEKAVLLATPGPAPIGSVTGPVPRLNYPKVHWWHEALVSSSHPATATASHSQPASQPQPAF